MKNYMFAALAGAALLGSTQVQAESHNPAIKSPNVGTTPVAAKGSNSFTESQAQGRIAKAGYTNVSKLVKNPNGIWQGSATKGGKSVLVGLDYKGNVILR